MTCVLIVLLVVRKYYYPYVISYLIRQNKIKFWFKDLSNIIIQYILNSIQNIYSKFVSIDLINNFDTSKFLEKIKRSVEPNGISSKRIRVNQVG